MILTEAERKRFSRIFSQLIGFARLYLRELNLISKGYPLSKPPRTDELGEILEAIWGESARKDLLDAFAADETLRLSNPDRRLVAERWRDGLLGSFIVTRQEDETFFLFDDYAFCVRGIAEEADTSLPELPVRVRCVLVPFGRTITYLAILKLEQSRFSQDFQQALPGRLAAAERQGRIAYTGEQFERLAPEALEDRRIGDVHAVEEGRYSTDYLGPVLKSEHRGLLAGLSWEERRRRCAEDATAIIESMGKADLEAGISRIAVKARAQRTLSDIICRHTISKLRQISFSLGMAGPAKREEYVAYLVDAFAVDAPLILSQFAHLGPNYLAGLRQVVEAGGLLPVEVHDDTDPDDLPQVVFPWLTYFKQRAGFFAVVPDELVEALGGTDWDAWERQAARVDDALMWLSVALTYRGVIALEEALHETCARFCDVTTDEVHDALNVRMSAEILSVVCAEIDGGTYLLAEDFMVVREEGFDDLILDVAGAGRVLVSRADIAPYWPSLHEGSVELEVLCLDLPEVHALMQYLDGHVPDDEDDYLYASIVLSYLISVSRLGLCDEQELIRVAQLFSRSAQQEKRMFELATAVLEVLPNRLLNGWSARRYQGIASCDTPNDLT